MKPALQELKRASRIAIVSHRDPDPDTIGSAIALGLALEAMGKQVSLHSADGVPEAQRFLVGSDRIRTDPPPADVDLVVTVDFGSAARAKFALPQGPHLLNIDHHASNGATGPTDWIEPGSAATCEMTALLAIRLGVALSEGGGALAGQLMAGIVMDTATFAHPNTTPRTLAVSAALVEAGAPLSDISRRLYRSKPDAQLRLFGRVLGRLETDADGRIIHASLFDADLDATGAIPAHSEGIIDLLAQSDDADVAILFKEAGEGTRLSVRTKPDGVDATVLTGLFGGGGHARASGATLPLPVEEARRVVLADAERLAAAVAR